MSKSRQARIAEDATRNSHRLLAQWRGLRNEFQSLYAVITSVQILPADAREWFETIFDLPVLLKRLNVLRNTPGVMATPAGMTPAARDVLAERVRQMKRRNWTPAGDDMHVNDELAVYACAHVMPDGARDWLLQNGVRLENHMIPIGWLPPKLGDRRRELVKGAALVLAEIERIDRAANTDASVARAQALANLKY